GAADAGRAISVVDDVVTGVTYADDLAHAIRLLLDEDATGTYHVADSGAIAWSDFARGVLDEAGLPGVPVTRIRAAETGPPAARGDVVIVQDADLEYDPAEYPAVLAPIVEDRADAVIASRFLGGAHRVLYYGHRIANGVLTACSNFATNVNLTDVEVGYKAV